MHDLARLAGGFVELSSVHLFHRQLRMSIWPSRVVTCTRSDVLPLNTCKLVVH